MITADISSLKASKRQKYDFVSETSAVSGRVQRPIAVQSCSVRTSVDERQFSDCFSFFLSSVSVLEDESIMISTRMCKCKVVLNISSYSLD